MATNTLIQKLYGKDETGVGEGEASQSNRRQVETFIASAAIVAGDAVAFDLSQTSDGLKTMRVLPASTGATTSKCFVGIALAAAAAEGDRVDVCLSGICTANVGGGGGVGVPMMISTGGDLVTYVDGVLVVAAHCASAVAGGKATVIVHKQF
jgi:hypothetical protein